MFYFYFYKITNNINQHFYYGVHKTLDLNDGYMGSGARLKLAYKKYGIENFTKEILKFFDSMEDAYNYEHEIVNENLISNPNCYNIQIGGQYYCSKNFVTVKDEFGNKFWVYKNDELYINKKVIPIWTGLHHTQSSRIKTRNSMTPKNSTNKRVWICKNGVVKYLLKEKLDEYLNDGWELGRVGYKPRKHSQGKEIK